VLELDSGMPGNWPDDDDERHHITCGCEDCMQDYPERFDEDWNNIYYVEPEELAQEAAQEKFERDWDV
jgi:nitric oxide reductase activation protein